MEGRKREEEKKEAKMYCVHVSTSCKECDHYVRQTYQ